MAIRKISTGFVLYKSGKQFYDEFLMFIATPVGLFLLSLWLLEWVFPRFGPFPLMTTISVFLVFYILFFLISIFLILIIYIGRFRHNETVVDVEQGRIATQHKFLKFHTSRSEYTFDQIDSVELVQRKLWRYYSRLLRVIIGEKNVIFFGMSEESPELPLLLELNEALLANTTSLDSNAEEVLSSDPSRLQDYHQGTTVETTISQTKDVPQSSYTPDSHNLEKGEVEEVDLGLGEMGSALKGIYLFFTFFMAMVSLVLYILLVIITNNEVVVYLLVFPLIFLFFCFIIAILYGLVKLSEASMNGEDVFDVFERNKAVVVVSLLYLFYELELIAYNPGTMDTLEGRLLRTLPIMLLLVFIQWKAYQAIRQIPLFQRPSSPKEGEDQGGLP